MLSEMDATERQLPSKFREYHQKKKKGSNQGIEARIQKQAKVGILILARLSTENANKGNNKRAVTT